MSSIELPDDLAAALKAAAVRRGVSVDELAAETLAAHLAGDALDGFVGCMDSGDPEWASTDAAVLRKSAAAQRID